MPLQGEQRSFGDRLADALGGFGAGIAGRGQEYSQGLEKQRQMALVQDAHTARQFLLNNDIDSAINLLVDRVNNIESLGGDPSDTIQLLNKVQSGDIAGSIADLSIPIEYAASQGLFELPKSRQGMASAKTEILADGTTVQALPDGTTQVINPAGQIVTGQERLDTLKRAQQFKLETKQAISDIDVAATGAKIESKGASERGQKSITMGADAAQGIPILRRSLSLLNQVKTGGFERAKLAASNLFGVTGADETELSTNLGRNVLSQLKTIFGAQFTEKEGERLEGIEANFGKSVKGNRRLLRQTLMMAEDAAKRGLKDAIAKEDFRTAAEIDDFLKGSYDITLDRLSEVTTEPAAQQQGATDLSNLSLDELIQLRQQAQ